MRLSQITVGPNLNAGQGVAVDIVVLNKATPFAEYIDAPVMAVVDFIAANCWIGTGRDPNTGKIVRMNPILNKLTQSRLVNVNATGLAVVDFATYNRWISTSCKANIFLKISQ